MASCTVTFALVHTDSGHVKPQERLAVALIAGFFHYILLRASCGDTDRRNFFHLEDRVGEKGAELCFL